MSDRPNSQPSSPPGKSIGQGMLFACCLLGLGALTLLFDGVLGRQANPNRNPASLETSGGVREVSLQRNRQGHYVADGLINDTPVTFLLDTGATDVAVPVGVANTAGLSTGSAGRAVTANGMVTVYSTQIDRLRLGNIELNNVNASITPGMPGNTILLGMSALGQIEFSQRGEQLTLRQQP